MLGDTSLRQQIKSSQEYDKEVSQALEVILKNGPRSLTRGLEEWNLEDGIILYRGVTAAWLLSVKLSNFGVRSDRPETHETLRSLEDQQTRPPHVPVMYLHLFHHLINLIPSFPLLITSAFDKHPSIVHITNPI